MKPKTMNSNLIIASNGEYVVQSQWGDTKDEAIDWAFVRDDHTIALMRAKWDEGCDTYGDIEFVDTLEVV